MKAGRLITRLDQVTPEWLTAVLTRSGALNQGAVAEFDAIPGGGNWSTNARLALRYTAAAGGPRPERLFLKLVRTDLNDESFGASEVAYYTRDYIDVPDAPLVRCYDAVFAATEQRYHLLLDDVSATHIVATEKTPTLDYALALAEGLAALHARWWGGQRLAAAQAPIHDADHIRRFVAIAQPGAGHIIERLAADLEPHWPRLIRSLYASHPPAIIARSRNAAGFTLIHGDVGASNILVPRQGHRPLYLIDRQPFNWSLTTWLGVYDLAYAMVLRWDIATRRRLELPALRHYHQELCRRGVEKYTWERLWADYRLCVPMGVYVATEYCRGGINETWRPVWWPMLRRALTACEDLNCRELWYP